MFTDLARRFRWFTLSSLIAFSSPMPGCAGAIGSDTFDAEGISDVDHTAVKRQSIGNCWIYAHATWIESMHKSGHGARASTCRSRTGRTGTGSIRSPPAG